MAKALGIGTFFAYPRSKRRRGWYGSSETVADMAV
jgi:hypothetical protein